MTTATRSLAAVALLATGCGGDAGGPATGTPRIDYVDGAIEPLLVRGQAFFVEGFGFGSQPGAVRFARADGGQTDAPIADPSHWTDFAIRATVPDDAVSGTVTVIPASGGALTAGAHVLPRVAFDPGTLSWASRGTFPGAPLGVALAVAELPGSGGSVATTLYAAGGADPVGGDSLMAPDAGVYVARAQSGGSLGSWQRQAPDRGLPAPRAFAAAVVATRHNSQYSSAAIYVIGGIDATGRTLASVIAANVSADAVVGPFVSLTSLPEPLAGASAIVKRGRIYMIGGADSLGRPIGRVFVGRIASDGRIDGWYAQPSLPTPRAYGGAVVLDNRAAAFGGVADSVPPGGGLDPTPQRLVTGDTASVSLLSGFFAGGWAGGPPPLTEGRSQFATLELGNVVLAVGGMYAGPPAETIAATLTGDSMGPFTGPVGLTTIAASGGGTLVGPAGASWREADGGRRGVVLGGMDLVTRTSRAGVWGF